MLYLFHLSIVQINQHNTDDDNENEVDTTPIEQEYNAIVNETDAVGDRDDAEQEDDAYINGNDYPNVTFCHELDNIIKKATIRGKQEGTRTNHLSNKFDLDKIEALCYIKSKKSSNTTT